MARNTLFLLLAFLALGAIGGGGLLILSPNGEWLGLPLYILKTSPFSSFLIPGIILFCVFGIAPALMILALQTKPDYNWVEKFNFFSDMHWTWSFTIYIAIALIVWIQVEMYFLQNIHWLHSFYIAYALLIIFVALLPQIRNSYRKSK